MSIKKYQDHGIARLVNLFFIRPRGHERWDWRDVFRPTGCRLAAASAAAAFQNATDLAREAVGCIPLSRRAVTSHRRNPFASARHPLLSYHDDQQLRPSRPLARSSPCCILVPLHPRLCHWWQLAHFEPVDPDHHALHSRCAGWSSDPYVASEGGLDVATAFYACHPSD